MFHVKHRTAPVVDNATGAVSFTDLILESVTIVRLPTAK